MKQEASNVAREAGQGEACNRMLDDIPLKLCLNLDRRPDRRLWAWEQFRREKLDVQRVAAPDAAGLCIREKRHFEDVGPRACAIAHRLAWREARRAAAAAVLVFEDDVVLSQDFSRRFESWMEAVPKDWQLLYLGCVFLDPPSVVRPGLLRVTGRTWDMHAYAVRSDVLPRLQRVVAPLSWRGHLPLELEKQGPLALDTVIPPLHHELRVYAPWPPLAWQHAGLSNNSGCSRGNYRDDGTQLFNRAALVHLPNG